MKTAILELLMEQFIGRLEDRLTRMVAEGMNVDGEPLTASSP
jgi:hypothetical protein